MTRRSLTTPSAERSLHHCSLRSEKNQRAVDKLVNLLKKVCCLLSSQSLSVGHVRTGRLVSDEFGSLISNVREKVHVATQKNEQIRILLERQEEQILAVCRAEIQKHEFHADCDRRSVQKLNGIIESQRSEINHAHAGDEQFRRDQHQTNNYPESQWYFRSRHVLLANQLTPNSRTSGAPPLLRLWKEWGRHTHHSPSLPVEMTRKPLHCCLP